MLHFVFFDVVVVVVVVVVFSPQGLSDTEEFVVCKALNALTCLAELGLLQKPTLHELVSEIVPFLCHPVSAWRFELLVYLKKLGRFPCHKHQGNSPINHHQGHSPIPQHLRDSPTSHIQGDSS